MLDEPYRWVEAIRNRREYVEDQLRGASPVVAARYADGLVLLTSTPGPRKLFEVYNEVAFAGVGHPADMEKLRKAAIDIAHLEAYNLSASDVSLQRLVSFGLGPLMKTAFDEVLRSPFLARVLVAELQPGEDREALYTVDVDGSFSGSAEVAVVAGTPEAAAAAAAQLRDGDGTGLGLNEQIARCLRAWAVGRLTTNEPERETPGDDAISGAIGETLVAQRFEAAVLDRTMATRTKFRRLSALELEPALSPHRD